VGNLTVGGTGKTPVVLYLLQFFQNKYPHYNFTVLSRGYKAKLSKVGAILPQNPNPILYGDEPSLIKKKFPNVQVMIGGNRVQTFRKYNVFHSKNHIVILDDGFQHVAICRDFDLVLLDANSPLGNGFTIPLGVLREPFFNLKRASAVLFTKINSENKEKLKPISEKINTVVPSVFSSHYQTKKIQVSRKVDQYVLVTGVGNPKDVLRSAKLSLNSESVELKAYSDHFEYSEKELLSLLTLYSETSNLKIDFITTEKDWIKISKFPKFLSELKSKNRNLYILELELSIEEETRFVTLVSDLVSTYEAKTVP
jgi:tetraacyldisaccharide 4'-kinase